MDVPTRREPDIHRILSLLLFVSYIGIVSYRIGTVSTERRAGSCLYAHICVHNTVNDTITLTQLNSTQRASMDAGVKTPQCPHLSRHYFISIL